jgi:uncharacterized surface protein with fasciclin (FAS1) repeats
MQYANWIITTKFFSQQNIFLFLKFLIMKKLCMTASMAVSLILLVSVSYAQEKTNTAMAKSTPATSVAAVKSEAVKVQGSTIADVVAASKSHSTLLVALKSAGLVETLKGAGPFTVFAPTNDAFSKIPAAALDNLLKPENKDALSKVLTGHVVSGIIKAEDILAAIKAGNGTASFATVNGDKLTATAEGGKVKLTDSAGNAAFVSTADVAADNGVIHIIDAVLAGK